MVTLLVQLLVLNMPTKRSANSNILLRKLIIMNCAFFVRSCNASVREEANVNVPQCLVTHSVVTYLDVVGYNRHVLEIKGCINLIHHIQRRRFVVVKSKHLWTERAHVTCIKE